MPFSCYFLWFMLLLVFLVARKEDNFRVMDRVLISLGTRGFSRLRWEFSVLAKGPHIFGRRPKPRATIKTWRKPETALEKSLAPRVCFDWSFRHHRSRSIFVGVGGRKSQNNGPVTGALFFSFPLFSHFALVSSFAQYAAFASLGSYIKRLLYRLNLAWTTTLG